MIIDIVHILLEMIIRNYNCHALIVIINRKGKSCVEILHISLYKLGIIVIVKISSTKIVSQNIITAYPYNVVHDYDCHQDTRLYASGQEKHVGTQMCCLRNQSK